ncbi:SRPBCC family protein [Levilactobacillus enshiensis]|uniref:SRPBCC family protein n=1 Tax=Levilactobacillus enshiensis TaxID=2590213 RepID=UPI00117BA0F7|nr:SRPBCC family protein [Levilactobacillus enshiensis]
MTKLLFQNNIAIHTSLDRVHAILAHPENLPLWDDEISQITPTATGFYLVRQSPALNTHERVTVMITGNQIGYNSQEGQLPYQLIFTLTEKGGHTEVVESLSVPDNAAFPVPLKLISPIAKVAFAQKLKNLAMLAESTKAVTV